MLLLVFRDEKKCMEERRVFLRGGGCGWVAGVEGVWRRGRGIGV